MVPLPKLKSGQKKKTHPKKLPKIAKNRQKQGKKHISSYKSNNIFGVLYVKPCAESNGTTPGLENWCNEKICPSDLFFNFKHGQMDKPTDISSSRQAILYFCDFPGPP